MNKEPKFKVGDIVRVWEDDIFAEKITGDCHVGKRGIVDCIEKIQIKNEILYMYYLQIDGFDDYKVNLWEEEIELSSVDLNIVWK